MNSYSENHGKKLRKLILKLWNRDIEEIDEYFHFKKYNKKIKGVKEIKRIIDQAFKNDELLIDEVDNIIRIAKCDAIQEIFDKMNVKYPDTETFTESL